MFDLIVRNATLPDGRTGLDIGIRAGTIAAIERGIAAEAGRVIDAEGCLVAPPFVDIHFHMDATLSLGIPRLNQSGTLLEGIALWGELKPLLTGEAVAARALRYCDLAVSQGPAGDPQPCRHLRRPAHRGRCAARSEADRSRPISTCSSWRSRRTAISARPSAAQNLERALDKGVDVVGGIPHFERTMEDGARSIEVLCDIAAERGLMVDMHCDETDDPLSRHIETLAAETQRLRPARPRRRLASDLDAQHGQLLCLEAVAADGGGAGACGRQPADQHRAAGPPRHLSEAARPDARAGNARTRHQCRIRPGLHDGPMVLARVRRHARGRAHGGACRADDRARGDALLLRGGDDATPRR